MKSFFTQLWNDRALILFEILHAPEMLWQAMAKAPEYRFFVVVGLVALAALLIHAFVRLVKSRGKKIFGSVVFLLVSIVAAAAVLCVSYRGASRFVLPEPERLTVGGETVTVSPQYSLAHAARVNTSFTILNAEWYLADDAVCWKLGEDSAAVLWDLGSLREDGSCRVTALERREDGNAISMDLEYGGSDEGVFYSTDASITVCILPWGNQIAPLWNCEPGDTFDPLRYVSISPFGSAVVLENDGEGVALSDELWPGRSDLYLLRRFGEDVVLFTYTGTTSENRNENNNLEDTIKNQTRSFRSLDSLNNEKDQKDMLKTLHTLIDRHFILLTGLGEAELAALLPDRITAYPIGLSELRDCFTFPCSELVEMSGVGEFPTLRFIGEGPDGESCLYTFTHGGGWFNRHSSTEPSEWYKEWSEAYADGKKTPDRSMTAFCGATAVKYRDGWLLNAGLFDGNEMKQNDYYYLTAEPLADDADEDLSSAG